MLLTIFTVCPEELDPQYLESYREALLHWNQEGLEGTQVILLPQSPIAPERAEPFEVVEAEYEQVNGYPVWDVMRAVRQAWPQVKGEYVSFDHPEFIWGPGRLDKTVAWLKGYRPIYARGNLRRPGRIEQVADPKNRDGVGRSASDWLKGFLDNCEWDQAAKAFEYLETTHWMFWAMRPQQPGTNSWTEDVFYADREWLDAWGFTRYGMEMPFQDVWDLIQVAGRTISQYGLPFDCVRMPQSVNRIIHLWHPRSWGSFTVEMRDWFLRQPERWEKTRLIDPEAWERLIAFQRNPKKDCEPVVALRFGPRGTAINYGIALASWLNNGGVEAMKEFYAVREERALA